MKDDNINSPSGQSFERNNTMEDEDCYFPSRPTFDKNRTMENQIIDALKVIADSKRKLKRFDEEQEDIARILKKYQENKESLHKKLQEFPSDYENKSEIDRIIWELFFIEQAIEQAENELSYGSYVYCFYRDGEMSKIREAIESLDGIPLYCAIRSHLQEFPDYQCRKCVRFIFDDLFLDE